MKKVLLLGDSIRMGYDSLVKELLKDECEVYYSDDNGRFACYTLWQANQMFKTYGRFDVVHWNNGYWDMNVEEPMCEPMHPIDEYCHFLKRIIDLCKKNASKIIFATTTPVLDKGMAIDNSNTGCYISYDNQWVQSYNEAAKKLMAQEGVVVNDLYAFVQRDKHYYKCPDQLHLTLEGYRLCAERVAEMIRGELKKIDMERENSNGI